VTPGQIHGVVLFGAYAVLWFLALLCLLPVGIGSATDPETGVPLSPRLGLKALLATAIAAVLFGVFYALIVFKVLDL
jgi:predicted secreted protein